MFRGVSRNDRIEITNWVRQKIAIDPIRIRAVKRSFHAIVLFAVVALFSGCTESTDERGTAIGDPETSDSSQNSDANPEPRVILDSRPGTIHVRVTDLDGDGRLDFVALISRTTESGCCGIKDSSDRLLPQRRSWRGPGISPLLIALCMTTSVRGFADAALMPPVMPQSRYSRAFRTAMSLVSSCGIISICKKVRRIVVSQNHVLAGHFAIFCGRNP